ncbi:zinc finger, CCHC-type containing protein [Tanacetum coccineum]|uniref:Zinc finger, CCHC-type containing protein n=1 Tax=Tanacetum coccineum TaxID=301880 RepID=A0ABQ4YBN8_9ASTR
MKIAGCYSFKHTLKHGKDDLSFVQLDSHLRIEESLRAQDNDKGKGKEVDGPSVNMTEEGKNKHNKQNKGKKRSNENNSDSSSNKKPKLECWKCVKTGHFNRDCRSGNRKNANAGGLGKGSKDHSQDQGQNLMPVWNSFVKYSVSLISESFYVQVEHGSVLYMGDDHLAPVHGKESVVLEFSSGKSITLFNVLYVPKLRKNLISGFGYYNNGMFMLNLNKVSDDSDYVYMSSSTVVNSSLWHARLGHVHYKRMLEMSKDDLIPAIDENPKKCTTCMLTKISRQPFKSITRKSVILELIHSDLCDFHATPSLGNKKYVINFIDDASRFCYVYLLHAKDEALDKFRIYKTEVELQQKDLIKTLRTDRGGEYYDPVFFQSVGIIHETIAPYIPQQNGVAERINRALKEMVNSMLSCSGLSEGFWGEAIAVVRLPDPKRKTLGEKGCKWIFKRKMKVDGTINKFKSRQKEGIDYFDTFAPVARITTIRLLLALITIHNLVIHQMDVRTAFLNGDLDEQDCSLVNTPMDLVEKLKPNTGKPVDQLEYSRAIGCLMYAMTSTRPDIAYVVGRLMLEAYSDASWINHVKDSSSTSRWVLLLGGGAISWASKKQTCIIGSTIESEFVALAIAGARTKGTTFCEHEVLPLQEAWTWLPIMVEHEQVLEDDKLSNNSLQWTVTKDLFSNLLKRFYGQKGYVVDENCKKSLMLSARGVIRSNNLYFMSSREARFEEVAMITDHRFYIDK